MVLDGALAADRRVAEPALVADAEVVGHVDHDHAGGEQQSGLEPQRALVVQQLLPPLGDHVFGDEHHDHGLGVGRRGAV